METAIYEDRAKQIISEIKETLDIKGISIDSESEDSILTRQIAEDIFSGKLFPSLVQFLALCEVSGITIHTASIETPDNPM